MYQYDNYSFKNLHDESTDLWKGASNARKVVNGFKLRCCTSFFSALKVSSQSAYPCSVSVLHNVECEEVTYEGAFQMFSHKDINSYVESNDFWKSLYLNQRIGSQTGVLRGWAALFLSCTFIRIFGRESGRSTTAYVVCPYFQNNFFRPRILPSCKGFHQ